MDAIVQEWVGQRPVAEAVAHLQRHRVPASPVMSPAELVKDEHLAVRNMVVDVAHPQHGPIPGVKGLGMPIKFVGRALTFDQPCPTLGAHNEEVYGGILGMDEDRLRTLKEQGVI